MDGWDGWCAVVFVQIIVVTIVQGYIRLLSVFAWQPIAIAIFELNTCASIVASLKF